MSQGRVRRMGPGSAYSLRMVNVLFIVNDEPEMTKNL
jgi:hypothetical protein